MANFETIMPKVFSSEGGYQAMPKDSGNYNSLKELVGTNHGISAPVYEQYLKRPPTVADMKAITQDTAKKIYKTLFWDKVYGDKIKNDSIAHQVFDAFVQNNTTTNKMVRVAINKAAGAAKVVERTSPLLSTEIDILNTLPAPTVFDYMKNYRIAFYNKLVADNPDKYSGFLKGWLNRVNKISFNGTAVAVGSGALFLALAFFF